MVGEDLSDLELFRAMVAFFGHRRTFGLIGLCVGWQVAGVWTWQEIEAAHLAEKTTWYRARVDLRRFREHLGPRAEAVTVAGARRVHRAKAPDQLVARVSADVDSMQLRVARLGGLAA